MENRWTFLRIKAFSLSLSEKKKVQKKQKERLVIKEAIFSDYEISEAFNKFFANLYPHVKIIDDENFETATKY